MTKKIIAPVDFNEHTGILKQQKKALSLCKLVLLRLRLELTRTH